VGSCRHGPQPRGPEESHRAAGRLKKEFWKEVYVPGGNDELNNELQKATRLADFIELGELMARDALMRENHAAGISGKNTRPPTGKPCATMINLPSWPRGNTKARMLNRCCIRKNLDFEFVEVKQRSYK